MGCISTNKKPVSIRKTEKKLTSFEKFINRKYHCKLQGDLWFKILDMLTFQELKESGKISK